MRETRLLDIAEGLAGDGLEERNAEDEGGVEDASEERAVDGQVQEAERLVCRAYRAMASLLLATARPQGGGWINTAKFYFLYLYSHFLDFPI